MSRNNLPPGFLKFWSRYPKKRDKGAAYRAWIKNGCEQDADRICGIVERYQFIDDPQFIKYPATWLNAWCFEDEDMISQGVQDDW